MFVMPIYCQKTQFSSKRGQQIKCFRVYESFCELPSYTNIYSWQYGRIKFDRHFNIANIHVVYIFFMRKTFRDESMFYANILTKYSLNLFYLEICYLYARVLYIKSETHKLNLIKMRTVFT